MMEEKLNNDLAKELLTIISCCDNNFVSSIPNTTLKKINELAADSKKEYYLNKTKSLEEQNISNECKDLLSLMYFIYMLDSNSQTKVLDIWLKNEKKF